MAVCETEVSHLKIAVTKVCENELPHIYNEIDKITGFLSDLKPIMRDVSENTKAIRNQEKLGKKEKAAILVSVIAAVASITVALITTL